MDTYWRHETIFPHVGREQCLFIFSIPKFISINKMQVATYSHQMLCGSTYYASLCGSEEKFSFDIGSSSESLKCSVLLSTDNGILLFKNTLNKPTSTLKERPPTSYYNLITLSSEDSCYQQLKQYPNDTLVLICRIKYQESFLCPLKNPYNSLSRGFDNVMELASYLKNSSEPLLEKVILRVEEKSVSVSKAILCFKSPVFAKMFKNDMKEQKEKIVTITDIKIHVLEALVSFLYSRNLPNFNFTLMCELYYAADKYDIADLRQLCVDLLLQHISTVNIFQFLKFTITYNNTQLKFAAMVRIARNIEELCGTNEWKEFIFEEPEIAQEVISFFDF